MSKAGDICPECGIHLLKLVKKNKFYNVDHLQCPYCDSTFLID